MRKNVRGGERRQKQRWGRRGKEEGGEIDKEMIKDKEREREKRERQRSESAREKDERVKTILIERGVSGRMILIDK